MPELKTGALSRADIQAVWEGSVDKGYRDPLVRAGEGRGFEVWTQLFAQFERASKAIDITTQAMFISPWSGQTNPPAAGGQKATVTLTLQRASRLHEPLFLQKGTFVVKEETSDFGPGEGVIVQTGRRYVLAEDVYFAPGQQGPFDVMFEADRFGYGFNNPLPGTIKAIEQNGSFFENDRATIEVTTAVPDLAGIRNKVRLISWNEPDMFVPDHIGQYVIFSAGANAGKIGRIVEFNAPVLPDGSAVALDLLNVIRAGDYITGYGFENVNTDVFLSSTQNTAAGMTFRGDGSKLGGVTFALKRTGAPTGNVVAKIYALTGSWTANLNMPTGPALATSDPVNSATLPTTYTQTRFTFSGVNQMTLTNLSNYVVVLEYAGGNSTNNVGIGSDSTAPTYPGFMTRLFGVWSALGAEASFTLHRAYEGDFVEGEVVTLSQGGVTYGYGSIVADRIVNGDRSVAFLSLSGTVAGDGTDNIRVIRGLTSGAVFTIAAPIFSSEFAAEAPTVGVGGASWRVLDWVYDWGLTATNALSPENGRAAFLDELGFERAIGRSPGESDDSYRERVREIADVVTPNAIRRALNRAIPGTPWCFREVGQEGLPGFFYDGTNEDHSPIPHGAKNDAYDIDVALLTCQPLGTFDFQEPIVVENSVTDEIYFFGWWGRYAGSQATLIRKMGKIPSPVPSNVRVRGLRSGTLALASNGVPVVIPPTVESRRYRVWLNYTEFRAFFLVTIPSLSFGEFGFPYDVTTLQNNGYDIPAPWQSAFDGYPYLAAQTYRRVYDAIEAVRAGGVGWQLRIDGGACP